MAPNIWGPTSQLHHHTRASPSLCRGPLGVWLAQFLTGVQKRRGRPRGK